MAKSRQRQRRPVSRLEAALAEFVEVWRGPAAPWSALPAARRCGARYLYYPSRTSCCGGVVEHALRHSAVYQPLSRRRKGQNGALLTAPASLLPTLEAVDGSEAWHAGATIAQRRQHAPAQPRLVQRLWLLMPGRNYVQVLLALAVKEGELKTRSVSRSAQLLASPFWMALVHNNLLASGLAETGPSSRWSSY